MKRNKRIISVRWLVFAVLVTAMASSVTLSRYMTTLTGTGTVQIANVALGDVALAKVEVGTAEQIKQPGDTMTYLFEVSNREGDGPHSDVTLEYSIAVSSTENLPLKLELTTREGGTPITPEMKAEIPYGVQDPVQYNLKITWPADETDPKYANLIDLITITVHAEQKMTAAN